MKKCNYCGQDYPDDATFCATDAQPLDSTGTPGEHASADPRSLQLADSTAADFAKRNMIMGGIWCVGGILITTATYDSATRTPGGGSYIVAWGAILFGGLQFLQGFLGIGRPEISAPTSSPTPMAASTRTIGKSENTVERHPPSPWTCPNCREEIEPQFSSCWKCRTPRSSGG